MTLIVDTNMNVILDGVNKGNFVDVLRSSPKVADDSDLKAALEIAWQAKQEETNVATRALDTKTILLTQAEGLSNDRKAAIEEAGAAIEARDFQLETAAAVIADKNTALAEKEAALAAAQADIIAKQDTIAAKDAELIQALKDLADATKAVADLGGGAVEVGG